MPSIKSEPYHFPDRSGPKELGTPFKKIVIVQVVPPSMTSMDCEDDFQELSRLVETLEGEVAGRMVQRRPHPHAEYYVGPGKADDIGSLCDEKMADTVVVDGQLTPTQIANLEHEVGSHIMDRNELILEIFSRRAKSAESKLQVELAYLDYFHPRLDQNTQTRAYRGGVRGFGESALGKKILATRARADLLRKKIDKLKKQTENRLRHRSDQWTVALVGYTNVGKSTLLNSLSGENIYADDRLFATLDTTTRRVFLMESRVALMSDTVGFINRLPHELIASFHSTLSEALSANLLLHVADASSANLRTQMDVVLSTLRQLNADEDKIKLLFNKIDAAPPELVEHLKVKHPSAIFISAHTREGLPQLRECLYDWFSEKFPIRMDGRINWQIAEEPLEQ